MANDVCVKNNFLFFFEFFQNNILNIMVKYRYTKSANTVPSSHPAVVRKVQKRDFKAASW